MTTKTKLNVRTLISQLERFEVRINDAAADFQNISRKEIAAFARVVATLQGVLAAVDDAACLCGEIVYEADAADVVNSIRDNFVRD